MYLTVYVEGGKLVFQVFASVAEFERDLIRERTMAGLEAVRTRGRNGGLKREMMGPVRATKMGPVPQPRLPRGAALRHALRVFQLTRASGGRRRVKARPFL